VKSTKRSVGGMHAQVDQEGCGGVCECEAEIWDVRGLSEGKAIEEVGASCKNACCGAVGIPGGGGSV
jgi:hypothetical protein